MHDGIRNFANCLYDNSLIPLITRTTRFGKSSSTLIDNSFTNKCNQNAISGILITDISNHLPIFYISKSEKTSKSPKFFTSSSRPLTEPGLDALRAALNNTDWSFVDDLLITLMMLILCFLNVLITYLITIYLLLKKHSESILRITNPGLVQA